MKILLIYIIVAISAFIVQIGVRILKNVEPKKIIIALIAVISIYILMIIFQIPYWFISDSLVLLISTLAGFAIGNSISTAPSLIAFCITAGIVDFVSFTGGLSAKIIEGYEKGQNLLLQYLCISIPINSTIVPLLGIGDLFVLGIIFRSLYKIGFESIFVSLIPILGLMIALLLGLIFHGIYALPMVGGITILYLIISKYLTKK